MEIKQKIEAPLFSIIIPTYNREKYIINNVKNLISQTYTNWELIIIDYRSSDCTQEKINSFLKDNRIKYIYKKNSEMYFSQFDYLRIYGLDYIHKLDNSGFKAKVTNISSNFKRFGLNKNEDLFICSK